MLRFRALSHQISLRLRATSDLVRDYRVIVKRLVKNRCYRTEVILFESSIYEPPSLLPDCKIIEGTEPCFALLG